MEASAATGTEDVPETADTRTKETDKATGSVETPGSVNTGVVETSATAGSIHTPSIANRVVKTSNVETDVADASGWGHCSH